MVCIVCNPTETSLQSSAIKCTPTETSPKWCVLYVPLQKIPHNRWQLNVPLQKIPHNRRQENVDVQTNVKAKIRAKIIGFKSPLSMFYERSEPDTPSLILRVL